MTIPRGSTRREALGALRDRIAGIGIYNPPAAPPRLVAYKGYLTTLHRAVFVNNYLCNFATALPAAGVQPDHPMIRAYNESLSAAAVTATGQPLINPEAPGSLRSWCDWYRQADAALSAIRYAVLITLFDGGDWDFPQWWTGATVTAAHVFNNDTSMYLYGKDFDTEAEAAAGLVSGFVRRTDAAGYWYPEMRVGWTGSKWHIASWAWAAEVSVSGAPAGDRLYPAIEIAASDGGAPDVLAGSLVTAADGRNRLCYLGAPVTVAADGSAVLTYPAPAAWVSGLTGLLGASYRIGAIWQKS